MKDINITTFKYKNIHEGIAYYSLLNKEIGISSIAISNITNILWHEIIHKILYEDISDNRNVTISWDNIAYELEDFLFR